MQRSLWLSPARPLQQLCSSQHLQSQLLKRLHGVERGCGVPLQHLHLVCGVNQVAADQLVQQGLGSSVLWGDRREKKTLSPSLLHWALTGFTEPAKKDKVDPNTDVLHYRAMA